MRTNKMPLRAAKSSNRGRPPRRERGGGGSSGCNDFQSFWLTTFRFIFARCRNTHLASGGFVSGSENIRLKCKLISLITQARTEGNKRLEDEAIQLMMENTGCQEDYEILTEIVHPHPDRNTLSTLELAEQMIAPSLSRWM
ncbi:hypothetical protein [Chromobacterium phragmitis]|uniref:hypothetical protein n=1 Tax=Chromobacterium phragmitis TaxID=2202141 RepID=UPI001F42DD55|nr:hypothetical protein [Chromobacterium phragmitis]